MLTLNPLEAAEFAAFSEVASDNYAKDNVANGRWNASDAPTLAKEETKRLLPEGEKTADNYLFVLRATRLNAEVGYLWYGTLVRGTKKIAFLYQIYIHGQFRRRGYGRQAMLAFEIEALKSGHNSLALNVSAINVDARRLYEATGYSASSLMMLKDLRRSDASYLPSASSTAGIKADVGQAGRDDVGDASYLPSASSTAGIKADVGQAGRDDVGDA